MSKPKQLQLSFDNPDRGSNYTQLIEQLRLGATVVTPNRRLAASLRRAFDLHARESGQTVWIAADALPWDAWLERLYREAFVRNAVATLLLNARQTRALWQRIVARAPEANGLLQIGGTAQAAEQAWELAHAWGLWPALRTGHLPEEGRAFLRWARTYEAFCTAEHLTDHARLPDSMRDIATRDTCRLPERLVVFGFDRLTPQQDRLLNKLRGEGVAVEIPDPSSSNGSAKVVRHLASADEIRAAAQWARTQLSRNQHARIGVVVPELTRLRPAIARIFDEILLPDAILHPGPSALRPWNTSLGEPLANWPLVQAGLLILELACGELSSSRGSLLLRSAFIGGADSERAARALLDARLRRLGEPRLTRDALIHHAAEEGHRFTCGILAERLSLLRNRVRSLPSGPRPVSAWAPAVQALLAAVHWPGERELNSDEYQTLQAWRELVASLGELDLVSEPLSLREMVTMLWRLAQEQLFQPESPDVPIQVLGVLESAHLEFDHLLVLGLDDEAWPRPPRPNPLLPIELQMATGLPGASAQWQLEFARRMQANWQAAATDLVFSFAGADGERQLRPSALLAGLQETTLAALGVEESADWRHLVRRSVKPEQIVDWTATALPAGVAFPGGARLLQDQSACPFRAFAAHRLAASALEHPHEGLDARDRGVLVHLALAGVWNELRSHQRLLAIESGELTALVQRGVDDALKRLQPRRASVFQQRFLELERERLTTLLLEWLDQERERTGFEVLANEEKRLVQVGGLDLNLRLDRVDRLASGGEMLIDYKTGEVALSKWRGERLDEPQLPLYTLAREAVPQAVAFGRVCRGETGFLGLSASSDVARGVHAAGNSRFFPSEYADWGAMLAAWRATLESLAIAFRSGAATVDPKKRTVTCKNCDLGTLCRVDEVTRIAALASAAEDADE